MTLVVNVPVEAEGLLREKAAREGQSAEDMASALLAEALLWDQRDHAEAVASIQKGLNDFEAGRFRPFEDFAVDRYQRLSPGATAGGR